jgi:hypothetical protein
MRKDFLYHWKEMFKIDFSKSSVGQKPIYPLSEIIIEKDDELRAIRD